MTPVFCIVKHNPDAGTFGDCVRACIASLLNMKAEDVPHFYHDNCDGEIGHPRIREWLGQNNLAPFWVYFDGNDTLEKVLEMMALTNPETFYMLYGNTGYGDHVVVCQGGKIVHDPAWVPDGIVGPNSNGVWSVMAITVK